MRHSPLRSWPAPPWATPDRSAPEGGRGIPLQLDPADAGDHDTRVRQPRVAAPRREPARPGQPVPDLPFAVRLDRVAQLVDVEHLAPRALVLINTRTVSLDHDNGCHDPCRGSTASPCTRYCGDATRGGRGPGGRPARGGLAALRRHPGDAPLGAVRRGGPVRLRTGARR